MADYGGRRVLFVEDLAALKGTSTDAIYMARARGQLPTAIRLGKRIGWRVEDVEAWLESNREPDPSA